MQISALVAQFPVTLSIPANLDQIISVLEQARAHDWVLFPEGALSGYSSDTSFLEHIDQHALSAGLDRIREESRQRKINVWVGACEQIYGRWFNSAYGFSANGTARVYHKVNLAAHERGVFSAGDTLPVFEMNTPGGVVTAGIQICRELRFPEQWSWLARSGAQVFLHLNNAVGDDRYRSVWKSHLVSRAAETQRFVLSANNAAARQGSPTIAVAPDGGVLGEIVSAETAVLRLELDLSRVSDWYLGQSRTDLVMPGPDDPHHKP